jgi:DNA repair photolyase
MYGCQGGRSGNSGTGRGIMATKKIGRGAVDNPPNRFETIAIVKEPDWTDPDDPLPATQFFRDSSRTIISYNDSPDVGFDASFNPYRGCEHGCIYCYARPTHEYFGLSAGLDFETKIFVKENAPDLLRAELSSKKWKPQVLACSGVTDCYQPIERRLKITRRCLEVLREFRNPVAVITKNFLVTRDADLFADLARDDAAAVVISVTSLDEKVSRAMEPRASRPAQRLAAIETLAKAGVPVAVNVAPVVPGLTDHEIPLILEACARAGARSAAYVALRLPYAVSPLFQDWLGRNFPDRKNRVLHRIQDIRGGKLYRSEFGSRMRGEGVYADQIASLFEVARRKSGLDKRDFELSTKAFRRPGENQLLLF